MIIKISLLGKNIFSLHDGFKAHDLEWIRVITNICLSWVSLKCGWHPGNAADFTCML